MSRDAIRRPGRSFTHAADLLREDTSDGEVILIKGRAGQRQKRLALALQGRTVGCDLTYCPVQLWVSCGECPLLESGWRSGMVLP